MTACAPGCIESTLSSLWRGRRTGIGYTPDPTLGNMEDSHSPRSRTRGGRSSEEAAAHQSVMVPGRLHDDHRIYRPGVRHSGTVVWGPTPLTYPESKSPVEGPGGSSCAAVCPTSEARSTSSGGATHLPNCRIITKGGRDPEHHDRPALARGAGGTP